MIHFKKLRLVFLSSVIGPHYLVLTYSFHMHVNNYIFVACLHSFGDLSIYTESAFWLPVTIVLLPGCSSHLCTVD